MSGQVGEIWSDLDHRLVVDSSGKIKKAINVEAVMTSIDNILRTSRGERIMLPEFGGGLDSVVFESMDDDFIDFFVRDIKDVIETWDDRVEVVEVSFLTDPDANSVSLKLLFSIRGYDRIFEYAVPIHGEVV